MSVGRAAILDAGMSLRRHFDGNFREELGGVKISCGR